MLYLDERDVMEYLFLTSDNDFEWADGGLVNNDLESKGWFVFSDREIGDSHKRLIENRKYLLKEVPYIYRKVNDIFKKETIVFEREDKSIGFKIYLNKDIAAFTFPVNIDVEWMGALGRAVDLIDDKDGFRIAKKSTGLFNVIKDRVDQLKNCPYKGE